MTVQAYQFAGGYGVVAVPNATVISNRNPVNTAGGIPGDTISPAGNPYTAGQYWENQITNALFVYLGGGLWTPVSGSGITSVTQLTGTAGTATPTAGSIQIAGTANQISTIGAASAITLSIPAVFVAPGSIASTTTIVSGSSIGATTTIVAGTGISSTTGNIVAAAGNINATLGSISAGTTVTAGTGVTATTGNITATNGNLVLTAAGNKMIRTSVGTTTAAGANSIGSVTLVGGTATIATTSVTAASLIRLWRQSIGATGAAATGNLVVGTITAGVSFVINAVTAADATALAATDVSVVGWEIIN